MSDWSQQVDAYLRLERNEPFRKAVERLRADGKDEQLRQLFGQPRLTFGTAGIRGAMGPGFGQMNDLVIIQTSQGLVSYLIETYGESLCHKRGVIIGHDARHNSARFARLTALAFLQRSMPVYFCDQIVPTPLVAFGVSYFNCYCGVMITASHNPKEDNGYKVYWSNGAQILSPHDKNIQAHIMRASNQEPWSSDLSYGHECLGLASGQEEEGASDWPRRRLPAHMADLLHRVYDDLCRSYFAYIQRLIVGEQRQQNERAPLAITYTAMHGVGHQFLTRALHIAGFQRLHPVEAQARPDPEFPTVRFPNPEEAGALDLAFATAARSGSTLLLANDPDADRCAAALYEPATKRRRLLSGNEIGQLLGWWAWHLNQTRQPPLKPAGGGGGQQARRGSSTTLTNPLSSSELSADGPASQTARASEVARGRRPDLEPDLDLDLDFESTTTDKTPATPITKPIIGCGRGSEVPTRTKTGTGTTTATATATATASATAPASSQRRPRSPAGNKGNAGSRKSHDCYMLSTAVSSRFLQTMALREGFKFVETLTGFKYMGNAAHELQKRGKSVLFAYEEAIGFMVDAQIFDKDGVSAAVQLAQCAAYLMSEHQRTLETQLDWLYARYGFHFSLNSYFLCRDSRTIRTIFHELQSNYPKSFASGAEEFAITRIRDLNNGIDNGTPDHRPDLPVSASSFMVTFWAGDRIRFTVRTSGTEPKIKYYSEIVAPLREGPPEAAAADKRAAQLRLGRFLEAAIERCLRPAFYKLEPALVKSP